MMWFRSILAMRFNWRRGPLEPATGIGLSVPSLGLGLPNIVLVQDNLNIHSKASLYEAFPRRAHRP